MAFKGTLTKLDFTQEEEIGEEHVGFFAKLVEEFKTILGFSTKRGPNVKYEVLYGHERAHCLQECPLTSHQIVVSEIYHVLEINKALAKDGVLIAPVVLPANIKEPEEVYTFNYWMKLGDQWQLEKAEYKKDNGVIHGTLIKMDKFFVVAELTAEEVLVGPEGATFTSRRDNRVKVDFPPGTVCSPQTFQFRLDVVKTDRYKSYKEYMPTKFRGITGLSSSLIVDHEMTTNLQKDARITLPVEEFEESTDSNVVFFHRHGDNLEVLDGDDSSDIGCYSVRVKSFSNITAFRKDRKLSRQLLEEAALYLTGQLSMCKLLTFIKSKYIKDMPAFFLDCVEATDNRPEVRAAELKSQGLYEIELSRSRGIPMENNCLFRVEIGGNLERYPGVSKSVLNMHFLQFSDSNHTVIPVRIKKEDVSKLVYRGQHNEWEHPVHFYIFPAKITKNLMYGKERLPDVRSSCPAFPTAQDDGRRVKQKPQTRRSSSQSEDYGSKTDRKNFKRKESVSDIAVLSQQSLMVLSGTIADPLVWRQIGIFLEIKNEDITKIFKKAKEEESLPALELLLNWRRNNRDDPATMVTKLIYALQNVERGDIAELVHTASVERQSLTKDNLKKI